MTGIESNGSRKAGLAQQRMLRIIMHRQIQRVKLIWRVLICNLLGFMQISVGQNDFAPRRFILLSFFSSLVAWQFLPLKIIFKAKMVRNSAKTVHRRLTRLITK